MLDLSLFLFTSQSVVPVNHAFRALDAVTLLASNSGPLDDIMMITSEALVVSGGALEHLDVLGSSDFSKDLWRTSPSHVIGTDQSRALGASDAFRAILAKRLRDRNVEARLTGVHLIVVVCGEIHQWL